MTRINTYHTIILRQMDAVMAPTEGSRKILAELIDNFGCYLCLIIVARLTVFQ